MKELVLHDPSQETAYCYSGLVKLSDMRSLLKWYPFEEDACTKAGIHIRNMKEQSDSEQEITVPTFSVTIRMDEKTTVEERDDSLVFNIPDFEIINGRSKCCAIAMLDPQASVNGTVQARIFILSNEKMKQLQN